MGDLVFVNANRTRRVVRCFDRREFKGEPGEVMTFGDDPDLEWEIVSVKDDGEDIIVKIKALGMK